LTIGPRKQLGIASPMIKTGDIARLTVFDPSVKWSYTSKTKKSISSNNHYLTQELRGRVLATIIGSKLNMA